MADVPATLLSNFEVLFTPQFPPGVGPVTVQTADELAIKGFFLTLSNINSTAFTFDIGFHCNASPGGAPIAQRTLASATAFLDDGATGVPLTFSASANGVDFSLRVTINARSTVLVGVLPQIFLGSTLPTPNVEIRGWVDLKLPALLSIKPGFPFIFKSQSPTPVHVITTPEQRITFLPLPTDAATAVEAQTAFALPSASGRSELQIPPQPGGPIILHPKLEAAEINPMDARLLESVSPETLSALMSGLAAGEAEGREGRKVKEKI